MSRKTALVRAAWTTALIAQVLLYYNKIIDVLALPHLIGVSAKNAPWNPAISIIGLDVVGVLLWLILLLLLEHRPLRDSKWIIGAFILLMLCVVATNFGA
jgi:hypothetical protein